MQEVLTRKEIQDPEFKWWRDLNLQPSPGSENSGICMNLNFIFNHTSTHKAEGDYQNLVSLLLGSHHANFMKPSFKTQAQLEKTVRRLGITIIT